MNKKNVKQYTIFFSILSIVAMFLCNRLAYCFVEVQDLNAAFDNLFPSIKQHFFFIGTDKVSLICGLAGFVTIVLFYLYRIFDAKNYRKGEEHGSSRWGTKKDAALFKDKNADNNIILSDDVQLNFGKAKEFEYDRNKNVVVVGGSGSGKTYSFVKPNLMQMLGSYVVTDPKGTLLPETGHMFEESHYNIRVLNTINFSKSMHYNPLAYIHSEKDILKLVNVLIENTKGEGDKSGEDFWVKSERLFYNALIAYLYYEAPEQDRNIPTMIDMLDASDVEEDDTEFKSPIDILFDELAKRKPDCFACKQYYKFKKAAGKTMKSILISCAARLAPFDIEEIRELMMYDELHLDMLGDEKSILYLIMPDTDNTFAFIIAMATYQLFNLLCDRADDLYGGKLPVPVICIFDEFANIGKIPNFEKLISTIRSRMICAMIILQSLSQLTATYKDAGDIIIDCCDSFVFLGGKSTKTTEQISKMIGKTTIDNQTYNVSKGSSGSRTKNDQVLGRDLIDPSEVGRISRTESIVIITGTAPWRSKKYNTSGHKNFKFLADSDKNNLFDISEYMSQKKQEVTTYTVEIPDEAA